MGIGSRVAAMAASAGAVGTMAVALDDLDIRNRSKASGGEIHPPAMPWDWRIKQFLLLPTNWGVIHDAKAIRRGWHVYKNVCKTCHSLSMFYFREMIGVSHTEQEVKEIAAEFEVIDEDPDENGDPVTRKCKTFDFVGGPYRNEAEARASNNGALPPDLTFINQAREGNEDYLYALLNGYCEAPAGVKVADGMNFNPYFAGGGIGMAQPIYNETVEYEDINKDVKPYQSQITKDIVTFLNWCGETYHDDREMQMTKLALWIMPATFILWVWNKRIQTVLKNQLFTRGEDLRKFKK